jgi:hypothetical protein
VNKEDAERDRATLIKALPRNGQPPWAQEMASRCSMRERERDRVSVCVYVHASLDFWLHVTRYKLQVPSHADDHS